MNGRIEVNCGCVPQLADLFLESGVYLRVAVTHRNCNNAGKEVQVTLIVVVPQPLLVALVNQQVLVVVGKYGFGQVILSAFDNLVIRRTLLISYNYFV